MSKVSARWVPRLLSPFQKDTRRQCCQENLELLTEDPEHFFQRLVTGDETWVYHRDPESKMESMQWKYKTSPTSKKFRVEKSAKSQAAIRQCGFQQLNHPPYSPDLAPSHFFSRVTKKFLRGKRFSSDEEVKEAVTTWFEEQSKDFFPGG